MTHFNGWFRLAIVFCAAWLAIVVAIAGKEYATASSGTFVGLGPPVGSIVSARSITLTNGRSIKLKGISAAMPWAVDWSQQPGVPVVRGVRWGTLITALLFPFAFCFVLFLVARVALWVKAGFGAPTA